MDIFNIFHYDIWNEIVKYLTIKDIIKLYITKKDIGLDHIISYKLFNRKNITCKKSFISLLIDYDTKNLHDFIKIFNMEKKEIIYYPSDQYDSDRYKWHRVAEIVGWKSISINTYVEVAVCKVHHRALKVEAYGNCGSNMCPCRWACLWDGKNGKRCRGAFYNTYTRHVVLVHPCIDPLDIDEIKRIIKDNYDLKINVKT
ncbi:Hypothetical protein ORPV_503 [Orpheovirus IHUMI-LCC2]|uniref:Uncharacterized protein n=1 Tax=Orpheovirus IHUMI-LCC2 TaxID=2023057 RepID=A0A2I2L4F3_9VIRU|nr:Hypothetical protein ORPV_503 [Orpheovirus IHUMI-LCC2]SNW62407.1 Hypothetical protein ORPV_503 [Orpheovirus IHUMI-LCC2]